VTALPFLSKESIVLKATQTAAKQLLAIGSVICAALVAPAALAADNVIMRINFTPWGMHAPYLGGKAQGIYAKEGIDLEIRPPSGGQQNEVFIGSGREHFGVANIDSFVKARASGVPVVAIMADQPDPPFAVITLKKSGIADPKQLKGKKLSWFQTNVQAQIDPLLKAGSLTRKDLEFVNVARGAEVQMLAAGQVDAIYGFSYGQALTLEEKGFPVNVMAVKDYGLNNYGSVIYTSEQLLKSNPDLVKRFVRATLKSLLWTKDHMEQAVAEVVKVSPDRELKLETRKLGIIYGLYKSPDYRERFGMMSDAKWKETIEVFSEAIPRKPAPQEMYTNKILESVDEARQLSAAIQKAK
jgi:NitT/TauT family transport system substrate-binding protein